MVGRPALLLLLLAASCFPIDFGEGRVACGSDGSCPPNYHCAEGRCYRYSSPDSGSMSGSSPDLRASCSSNDCSPPDLRGSCSSNNCSPPDLLGSCFLNACSGGNGCSCPGSCQCSFDCSQPNCNATSTSSGATLLTCTGTSTRCQLDCRGASGSCALACQSNTPCLLRCGQNAKSCQLTGCNSSLQHCVNNNSNVNIWVCNGAQCPQGGGGGD
jgi:hypothetical protein